MSESNPPPPPGDGYGSPPPPPGGGYGSPPPPPGGGYGGPPSEGGGYGSAPPPPPGGGYGPPGGYSVPQTDQKAVWSLVLGILGLVCCGFFTGIPALILGRSSQQSIDASGGRLTGRGMATAGFVMGIISTVMGVIGLILFFTGALDFDFDTSP